MVHSGLNYSISRQLLCRYFIFFFFLNKETVISVCKDMLEKDDMTSIYLASTG